MNSYLVCTQTMENKGAECGSGRFNDNSADWRFKFGSDYIITGVDKIQDAVAFVGALVINNGIGIKEWPCHWETVDPDFKTDMEKSQLEYEGHITYPARRINVVEYMAQKERA